MDREVIIREATLADVPDLVAMGRRFRATSGYSTILAENVGQMEVTASHLIDGPRSVVFVAEGVGGDLIGMIGLQGFQHPMSGDWTVGEAFWWSEQAGAGLRLFERGKKWAIEQGAVKLQMTQPESEPRLGPIYAHLGFQRIEVAWQLDLEAA